MKNRYTVAERIMNWRFGRNGWDENSPAHRFWKRQVKKRHRSLDWWNKNHERIDDNGKLIPEGGVK